MASKYLIYDNNESAEAKNTEFFERLAIHYPAIYATSVAYCTVVKHYTDNLWAVYLDTPNFPLIFTEQEINDGQTLTSDWYSQAIPPAI